MALGWHLQMEDQRPAVLWTLAVTDALTASASLLCHARLPQTGSDHSGMVTHLSAGSDNGASPSTEIDG